MLHHADGSYMLPMGAYESNASSIWKLKLQLIIGAMRKAKIMLS